jgi:TolB-like protein/DNA-binding winged helix-turn-helix (wHTH) protein
MQGASSSSQSAITFGVFEADPRARELRKKGILIKLQQQPFELLMILLEHPGQVVSREEVRKRLWPADVYLDFDRGLNKAMVKLREALGDSSESPLYIETLPRVGYRFIGPVNTAPRQTFEAASREAEVATLGSTIRENGSAVSEVTEPASTAALERAKPRSSWRMPAAIGVAVLLTAGIAGDWRREHSKSFEASPIRSVAVLPLDNLSGDPNQEYFADGMTDELTTMLAKNSNLHVTSRTSAMRFKGARQPLRDIARELGVDGILEGSIARSGDNVHMTVQLIRASDDAHVWAESYDRKSGEVAALPSEAAETIAKKLNSAVASSKPARYVNPEAHDAYLHGLYLWFNGKNEEAHASFTKATELQPDYALGWVGQSFYYGVGADDGDLNPADALPKLEAAAKKAVELDDELPEAHLARSAAYYVVDWDWTRADQEILRAIELNPRYAEGIHFRQKILLTQNRYDEAIELQKQATEIDGFSRTHAMAQAYSRVRRFDEAAAEAQQRVASDPNDRGNHQTLSYVYRCQGKYKESVEEMAKVYSLSGWDAGAAGIRNAFDKGGYKGAVQWQLDDLKQQAARHYVSPANFAVLTAQLGQREQTLALLEDALRQHSPQLLLMQTEPAFDFLHSEERYHAVIRGVGMPPAY